ncbi:hypothetical protein, variant 4 [Exophiala mesophila]|uniref:Uncharacterized protein n=1 Tax=Exophiala mesophila TaxID=212818 RepID=A0A0D1Z8S2_EXOME|nr:uncharacterized protein PV10_05687 [Exophiala mesophila]XP_016222682.1 hypothetical protein, variant 1 [Exophiala mesophila]XP_016222683.1 hypothetical protein, variant 2 [Exophiala mesophila]XP_016222684.1 hypothetical protein, variant 3 [Exophiala mesophila]XP_016222685.1 hypothetical protein, variant 4 [Exophiala mesophila]KIV91107.1 hypothetical protein PV10_05687 [Exophiala mesophila]KIV91108.1 hypothetical protein, variant 1 [Exophiala mesophila]KIV91109.1 hypothetical protein, vari
MKDKRGLMKFLRFALQQEEDTSFEAVDPALSFTNVLSNTFKIRDNLQAPLLALALSPTPAASMPFSMALSRIRRHMRSMGYFGPGFGAVVAKYGGNSEMAQVACRAGAVGGAVYLLGHHLTEVQLPTSTVSGESTDDSSLFHCTLSDGTPIRSKVVVGSLDDLPPDMPRASSATTQVNVWRTISIVADPLRSLFPQTADNGPVPAVAIVLVDTPTSEGPATGPIYLQVHSEDTGECPSGQSIIYASLMSESASAQERLKAAVDDFVEGCGAVQSVLWTLSYRVSTSDQQGTLGVDDLASKLFCFRRRAHDLSFSDDIIASVKEVWTHILGSEAVDEHFLRFEERETEVED